MNKKVQKILVEFLKFLLAVLGGAAGALTFM